ncbi:MAG TPA: dihydrolipoamide acetyltransferase family protein [Galbitalea sp.]
MANEFLLPDLGEGLTEAEIVTWLVAEGDVIVIDQPVVEVESAKSSVELPSPFAGRVEKLHAQPGDVVHKGSVLVSVVPVEVDVDAAATAAGRTAAARHEPTPELVQGTAVRESATGPGAGSGSGAVLVGYGTKEATARPRRTTDRPRFGKSATESHTQGATVPATEIEAPFAAYRADTAHSPVISPLIRKRARTHGLDASTLRGTGPGFLVTRDDVDAAIAAMEQHVAAVHTGAGDSHPEQERVLADASDADIRTPISGMRKIIGSRLSHSRATIPEATIWLDVDATGLFEAKQRLEKSTGERFSLTALLARFVVAGLKLYPLLNSSVDDERGEFVQHASINLGLAAQTSRGLMVPVISDAGAMTTIQLRDAVADLVIHSQAGDFAATALRGGTFTLNNYGGFGVDGSTPIINHPEVAMLGVGRMIDRPWVVDGQLMVRKVVTLSFVFDHRVCDGDVASGFLTYVARCVEEPLLLLGGV